MGGKTLTQRGPTNRGQGNPNRLDASLHDFVGVADYVGPVSTVDELRADVDRFARILLGYDPATGELPRPPASRS
jgi:hypothetical protein